MEMSFGDLRLSSDIWEFPVEECYVLARADFPGLYILNSSARILWDIAKGGVPYADLVRKFASRFDAPPDQVERDVEQVLTTWQSGLLSPPAKERFQFETDWEVPAIPALDCFSRDYSVHHKNVRIALQTCELVEEIVPRLESLMPAHSAPDIHFRVIERANGFSIFRDRSCISQEASLGETRVRLLQEIVLSCRERDCLAVFHAGACGSNSRCVIFPASTQAGKTTLAAVLMNKGWTFYADDSVLLERDTLSVPVMPFSLTVREGSWNLLFPRFPELQQAPVASRDGQRVRFLTPAGMNHDCSGQAAAMVFVQFDPGGANQIRSLDILQTLLRLQETTFWVAHDEQSIRSLLDWLQATPCFSLCYSDVDQAAAIIGDLI